ncbi:MAG: P63C domain-containing protein [Gemmatimonadaceae bacterium]
MFATVDGIPFFLQAEALKPFITNDLLMSTSPVFYISKTDVKSVGYDARILPNVADVYLKYRDRLLRDGKQIPDRYEKIFAACDALMRFLAKQGIVSLVDRATGYTDTVEREAVARLLEAWISEKLQPYVRTFPVSWFKQLCRLKGIEFRTDMKLPRYVGKLVNDLVWNRLGPGVRQWLDQRTPRGDDGRLKQKKFQSLTKDYGIQQLVHHLGIQEGLMLGFADGQWDAFYDRLNRTMPPFEKLPLFDQPEEREKVEAPTLVAALPSSSSASVSAEPDSSVA